MNRLFTTTALALLVSGAGLHAQTAAPAPPAAPAATATAVAPPEITPPEGFTPEDVVFSAENLDGATVYDATGERIGEVHGLVFANGTTTTTGTDTAAAPAPADAASDAPPATSPAVTDETGDMSGTPPPDPNAGTAATDATGDAATAEGETIKNVGSDATTVTPTDATTPPTQDAAAAKDGAAAAGEITEAVVDVGGFLGMGEHRVAVPIGELVAYRKDDELRIYLPWTRDQLMALPEFEMKNPA